MMTTSDRTRLFCSTSVANLSPNFTTSFLLTRLMSAVLIRPIAGKESLALFKGFEKERWGHWDLNPDQLVSSSPKLSAPDAGANCDSQVTPCPRRPWGGRAFYMGFGSGERDNIGRIAENTRIPARQRGDCEALRPSGDSLQRRLAGGLLRRGEHRAGVAALDTLLDSPPAVLAQALLEVVQSAKGSFAHPLLVGHSHACRRGAGGFRARVGGHLFPDKGTIALADPAGPIAPDCVSFLLASPPRAGVRGAPAVATAGHPSGTSSGISACEAGTLRCRGEIGVPYLARPRNLIGQWASGTFVPRACAVGVQGAAPAAHAARAVITVDWPAALDRASGDFSIHCTEPVARLHTIVEAIIPVADPDEAGAVAPSRGEVPLVEPLA